MMHKSVAGEFQKEVDNTTVLLDDILSILALLEAGDWSEHCTKTELGGRLEREITRLIGDAQEATVTSYELIAEAWRFVKAGEQGLPVGELQKQLGIPGSTLSHHISALVSVGLVKQNRESRTLMCVSQYAMLEAIIEFLREECCVNSKIA